MKLLWQMKQRRLKWKQLCQTITLAIRLTDLATAITGFPSDATLTAQQPFSACVASTACNGNGSTTDLDDSDGCTCACDTGYSGSDCGTVVTTITATTTVAASDTANASVASSDDSGGAPMGAIIGGVAGGVILLGVAGFFLLKGSSDDKCDDAEKLHAIE